MTDAGMFDRIINALMKKVGSNVVGSSDDDLHYRNDRPSGRRGSIYIFDHDPGNASGLQTAEHASHNASADLCNRNGRHEPASLGRSYHAFRLRSGNRCKRIVDEAFAHADRGNRHCTVYRFFLGDRGEETGRRREQYIGFG